MSRRSPGNTLTSRAAFFAREAAAWERLQQQLDSLEPEALTRPGACGADWSVKDVLNHLAAWQEAALRVVGDLRAGRWGLLRSCWASLGGRSDAAPAMSVFRHIVLDTNVFVAAGFKGRSHAAHLLAAVRGGALILVWHLETRAEVLYVLGRIPPLRRLDVAELFRPDVEYTAPLDLTPSGCIPDPADRVFAVLAEAAGAALVTNDAHLLDHRHALRVPVPPPRVFWETWVRGADVGAVESEGPRRTHDDD